MEYLRVMISSVTLGAAFRLSAPLLIGLSGESFSNMSGVFNIHLESVFNISAFFSLLGSYLFKNALVGVLFGIVSGILLSMLYGLFIFTFGANGLITGVGFNLSSWGITTMLLVSLFQTRGATNVGAVALQSLRIPGLENLPYLSGIFNNQTILVYIAPFCALIAYIVMYRSKFGLHVRLTGSNHEAAEVAGVNPRRVQWIGVLTSGLMMGLGGSYISLNGLAMFSEGMVAGRGFLVLASILVGKANPLKSAAIAFMFAYAQALTLTWSGFGLYNQIIEMIPYLVVIIVLIISHAKNLGKQAAL